MLIGVVAACAVLAACGLVVYAVRRFRRNAERRLEVVLERLGRQLDAISASVEQSVERVVRAQAERLQPLTLDFDALTDEIVAQAAARTGADAVVLRVEGPGGRPVVATHGPTVGSDLVERTFAPLEPRPFRAATIDWTYSPSGEAVDDQYRSALVAPLAAPAGVPGTLVAYSTAANAFLPEHTAALHDLLAEVATGLANARRFADVEARLLLDPSTGVTNRRGYAVELGREVARATRNGRPLSVVLVGIPNGSESATTGEARSVDEFARLLTRVTRRSDISCRRSERQFAILLPETRAAGATVLTNRLREEARRALGTSRSTITVGHVEWLPEESVEALEARVEAALESPGGTWPPATPVPVPVPVLRPAHAAVSVAAHAHATSDLLRDDVLEAVAREILEARRYGRSLAVVAIGIDGVDELSDVDRESADSVLSEVARRLAESTGGATVLRLGPNEFVLALSGASAHDAEALLGSLHDPGELAGVTLTAGVTELVERDGAQTAVGRAEHALWQARQAGRGTVVVAVPGAVTRRFE